MPSRMQMQLMHSPLTNQIWKSQFVPWPLQIFYPLSSLTLQALISYIKLSRIFIFIMIIILTLLTLISAKLIQYSETQPHSNTCYSQGLFFLNSTHLFQSCGLYNQSYYQLITYSTDPFELKESWKSEKPWKMNIFLEGVTLFKNFIYLLTWREHIVYKLNPITLQEVDTLHWQKDGWGLTQNETHLFVTDGSHRIYLTDENFKILETKEIKGLKGKNMHRINELEFVQGYIYANIYLDRKIVKISYEEGRVIQEYDGFNLLKNEKGIEYGQVLNGIAYNENTKKYVLTGKNWKYFYELNL